MSAFVDLIMSMDSFSVLFPEFLVVSLDLDK